MFRNGFRAPMIVDNTLAEEMLAAVGELLAAESQTASIVVVGGTALNLLDYVDRPTQDVDVLARTDAAGNLIRPDPFPEFLRRAAAIVARDFDQPLDWMNTQVARQWDTGLPPGLASRIEWREYTALRVGLVGRQDLIAFKLYATADQTSSQSVHARDLLALAPNDEELARAADWVRTQDESPAFRTALDKVITYVREQRR